MIAHVYSYEELSFARLTARMARSDFNTDRANAIGVVDLAARSNAELPRLRPRPHPAPGPDRAHWRTDRPDRRHDPPQDIRRPLGLARGIPADRLGAALHTARTAPTIGAPGRIRDLTLTATDLDWSIGDGPLVEGSGEALLMAIAGRKGITTELAGPGVSILSGRITG